MPAGPVAQRERAVQQPADLFSRVDAGSLRWPATGAKRLAGDECARAAPGQMAAESAQQAGAGPAGVRPARLASGWPCPGERFAGGPGRQPVLPGEPVQCAQLREGRLVRAGAGLQGGGEGGELARQGSAEPSGSHDTTPGSSATVRRSPGVELGADEGRVRMPVAEHVTDALEGLPAAQQMDGQRVTQDMGTPPGCHDARLAGLAAQPGVHLAPQRAMRRPAGQEDLLAATADDRPAGSPRSPRPPAGSAAAGDAGRSWARRW